MTRAPGKTPPPRHWSRRVLAYVAVVLVVNFGGVYVLAALGIIDRLLASSVPLELGVLPLALVFFSARLLALFVVPGLVAAALVLGWLWPPGR